MTTPEAEVNFPSKPRCFTNTDKFIQETDIHQIFAEPEVGDISAKLIK